MTRAGRAMVALVIACACEGGRARSADDAVAQAKAYNDASFAAALAAKQLSPLALAVKRDALGEGLRTGERGGGPPEHPPHEPGTAFVVDGQTFVAGEVRWDGSPRREEPYELAIDPAKRVYKIVRVADPVSRSSVVHPGCQHESFGSPCSACGSTAQAWYGPLPAGATYAGPIEIHVPTKQVDESWADGSCHDPAPP